MGHSSIHVTFDTYGHLFPGRGREASARYEKSMDVARRKSEATASNPLAIDSEVPRKPGTSNQFSLFAVPGSHIPNRRSHFSGDWLEC